MKGIPKCWNIFDIYANLIFLIINIIMGVFILINNSILYLILYIIFWVCYIIIGRYFTCRDCDFIGKLCPSWCMGIIAKFLYKRSERPHFDAKKAMLYDVSFVLLVEFIPFIPLFINFIYNYSNYNLLLLLFYTISVFSVLIVHSLFGCKKCPLEHCPMAKKKSE